MRKTLCIISVILLGSIPKLYSQRSSYTDSLLTVLKTLKDDTIKLDVLDKLLIEANEDDEKNKYNELIGSLSEKLNESKNKLIREASFTYYASYLSEKGYYLYNRGAIENAIKYWLDALRFCEKTNNLTTMSSTFNNLAYVYQQQGENKTALRYYNKALEIDIRLGQKMNEAQAYNNIGILHFYNNSYDTALFYYNKALKIIRELNVLSGVAGTLSNIGRIYIKQGDLKRAFDTSQVVLKLRLAEGDKQNIVFAYENLTGILMKQNKLNDAIAYGNKLMQLSKELNYPLNIRDAAELMEIIYEKKGDSRSALEMYKLYTQMRDSINNDETKRTAFKKQLVYDSEKKEAQLKTEALVEQAKTEQKADDMRKRQNIIIYASIAVMILLAGFLISVFRGLKLQRKANKIISLQKEEVELQKEKIEEHQKEIIDSIRYARRIQRSLLPTEKYIERKLKKK